MATLLAPKARTRWNRIRTTRGKLPKALLLGFVGLFFWGFAFAVIYRMLLYFRGTEGIGGLLAAKLLGIAFLTFFMILLLSNVITALSTFFLSDDLELLAAAPVDGLHLYLARLGETVVDSSWMVALLALPLLGAYGVVYGAGPSWYLLALAVLAAFLVIPAVVGGAGTLLLVNLFPARRTRDLLALLGLFAAAAVVALFRFLRPERLVRPEEFRDLVDFMAALRTPTSAWLPSQWAADALMSGLEGFFDPHPFLLLATTAGACLVGGAWLHGRFHRTGFSRAQEGREPRAGRRRSRGLAPLLSWLPPAVRQLVAKEVRVFFRDTTQWSQLILLGVLVVVYVYNVQQLPLFTGERLSEVFVNVISLLNLGLAGFVVAAIAARFVFPAMSLEGRMMWLLRSSPFRVRRLFWTKFWVGTLPLLAVALPLMVATNLLMGVEPLVFWLTTGTMVAVTLGLSAMALGMGALYPNPDTENVAEIPTSFGGLLYMMCATLYLGVVVLLEGWPVLRWVRGGLLAGGGAAGPPSPGPGLAVGVAAALLVTAGTVLLFLRLGIRRVESEPAH
ncbi:MAG: hypothetical protein RQ751_00885 [Longimicrobiales bacterium]|nr:hypothetical protein [Longimicrobiales bacterium]